MMKSSCTICRTRIQVCGITCLDDALYAAQAGADSLGFHFYPESPCVVTVEQVANITQHLPPFVDRSGIFVDATVDDVLSITKAASLTAIQLSGKETPRYCKKLRTQLQGRYLINRFPVDFISNVEMFMAYKNSVDALLLELSTWKEPLQYAVTTKLLNVRSLFLQSSQIPCILGGNFSFADIVTVMERFQPWCLDIFVQEKPGLQRINRQQLIRCIQIIREMDRGMLG